MLIYKVMSTYQLDKTWPVSCAGRFTDHEEAFKFREAAIAKNHYWRYWVEVVEDERKSGSVDRREHVPNN